MRIRLAALAVGAVTVPLALGACAGSTSSGSSASASASAAATMSPSELTGTWISTSRTTLTENGKRGSGSELLIIGPVQDNVFEATREIAVEVPADFGDGKATTTATLKTFGVVNPDGSFTIVKKGDDGMLTGWPVDANTINAVYTESGAQPYVARATLVRKKN